MIYLKLFYKLIARLQITIREAKGAYLLVVFYKIFQIISSNIKNELLTNEQL